MASGVTSRGAHPVPPVGEHEVASRRQVAKRGFDVVDVVGDDDARRLRDDQRPRRGGVTRNTARFDQRPALVRVRPRGGAVRTRQHAHAHGSRRRAVPEARTAAATASPPPLDSSSAGRAAHLAQRTARARERRARGARRVARRRLERLQRVVLRVQPPSRLERPPTVPRSPFPDASSSNRRTARRTRTRTLRRTSWDTPPFARRGASTWRSSFGKNQRDSLRSMFCTSFRAAHVRQQGAKGVRFDLSL